VAISRVKPELFALNCDSQLEAIVRRKETMVIRDLVLIRRPIPKTSAAILCSVLLSFTGFSPAKADGSSTVVFNSTGSPDVITGMVDATGNIVDINGNVIGRSFVRSGDVKSVTIQKFDNSIPDASLMFINTLESRSHETQRLIAENYAANTITAIQYADFNRQLGDIIAYEVACKSSDGVLTFNEALKVGQQLDALDSLVATTARVQVMSPVVIVDAGGSPRIAVTTRRVSTDNGDGTKTVVTTTSQNPGLVIASTPIVTSPRSVTIISNPATIISLLDSRRFELDRLIAAKLVNGQINAGQALQLRTNLDVISNRLSDAAISGYASDDARVITIARDLDSLSNQLVVMASMPRLTPITVVDTSGTAKISVDSFGNIISVSAVKPELFLTTLDGRIHDIQRLIASGEASGRISRDRANAFRAELDRLTALEAQGRSGSMTYVQALPIATQLDALSDRIAVSLSNQSLSPLIAGSRFVLTSGQVVLLDDVMVRRADLEGKISEQLAEGKLTPDQAASLRQQLDDIGKVEAQMRAGSGDLSFKQGRSLYGQFDKVGSRLDHYIAHN
jgi:hypothetical protein